MFEYFFANSWLEHHSHLKENVSICRQINYFYFNCDVLPAGLFESELWVNLLLSGCMLVNNAGTLESIDTDSCGDILQSSTFCVHVY